MCGTGSSAAVEAALPSQLCRPRTLHALRAPVDMGRDERALEVGELAVERQRDPPRECVRE